MLARVVSSLKYSVMVSAMIGATFLGCAAHADEPALLGVFVNPNQPKEPLEAAIEQGVKNLNFIVRPIARSRLKKTNSALTRVEMRRIGKLVWIKLGLGKPTETEPGQPPVKWMREDGDEFDVATRWQGSTLIQTFSADDGSRQNRFTLSPDGSTLTLHVVLSSPQLNAPIEYKLNFKREGA